MTPSARDWLGRYPVDEAIWGRSITGLTVTWLPASRSRTDDNASTPKVSSSVMPSGRRCTYNVVAGNRSAVSAAGLPASAGSSVVRLESWR